MILYGIDNIRDLFGHKVSAWPGLLTQWQWAGRKKPRFVSWPCCCRLAFSSSRRIPYAVWGYDSFHCGSSSSPSYTCCVNCTLPM